MRGGRLGLLAAAVALVALAGLTAGCGDSSEPRLAPGAGLGEKAVDPLAYDEELEDEYTERAAAGHSHVLYAKSPGGVQATARRVAALRPVVEEAAGEAELDADLLEAVVFLESAGRPDVIAGDDPANAAGLTQILAETGQGLLGMDIDLAASRRLTRRYRRELRRGHPYAARRALAARRRVDDRFVPAKALAATGRYLAIARERLGRDDLALVSYHMGIGNLEGVLAAYGEDDPSYARLYFDSTPLRHAEAWRRLDSLGDDSATYYWRVLAAREIMRLYREESQELDRLALLHGTKGSAEEVLHPREDTEVFARPADVAEAREDEELVGLPSAAVLRLRRDRRMGELAPRLGQRPALYHALRPEALAVAAYFGAGVRSITGRPPPLTMTSAVRDEAYQALLARSNPEATHDYSLHTTGYSFDLLRRYPSRAHARALQFLLDRLQSLNLIAWVREPAAIHVTVSRDAAGLEPVLPGR